MFFSIFMTLLSKTSKKSSDLHKINYHKDQTSFDYFRIYLHRQNKLFRFNQTKSQLPQIFTIVFHFGLSPFDLSSTKSHLIWLLCRTFLHTSH